MVILGIIIIALAFVPAWVIWTKRTKYLSVKIILCVLSTIIGIALVAALSKINDKDNLITTMTTRNYNYVQCLKNSETNKKFSECVSDNALELSEIYLK